MTEPESGEALFSGRVMFGFFNNFKKLQTASAHRNLCGNGDGGCINLLGHTVVAQHMESKGIISVYFLMLMHILGYLCNTCTPQYSK